MAQCARTTLDHIHAAPPVVIAPGTGVIGSAVLGAVPPMRGKGTVRAICPEPALQSMIAWNPAPGAVMGDTDSGAAGRMVQQYRRVQH